MDTHEAVALGAVAKAADAGLKGLDARSWRDRLEGSLDDLRSAFEVLLDEDRSAALQMATGVVGFWTLTSRIPEGRGWLDRACAAADPDDATLPRALYENALLAFWQGDDDISRSLLARKLNHLASVASEAGNLSVVERQLGNMERATQLALESLALSEQRGDEWMLPYQLNALAGIAAAKKDFARAATLLGAAAGMMERMGTAWPPDEKPHFETTRSAAEAALAPDSFERAWAEGEHMTLPDMVALAQLPT